MALITYYYDNSYKSLKEIRTEKEKELIKNRNDATYPDYKALKAEMQEEAPSLVFTIRNDKGEIVKKEFKKLLETLKQYEDHPLERRAFLYLDIISWLESKIEKKYMLGTVQ